MNRRVLGAFLSLVVILIPATTASAQSHTLAVNIPFNFNWGETALSKGHYTVRVADHEVLQLMNSEGKSIFSLSHAASRAESLTGSALIFQRYGQEYFLSQVVWSNGPVRELPKTKGEIEIAKR